MNRRIPLKSFDCKTRNSQSPGGVARAATGTIRLNGELEDTNRGVVALYAELDEKAGHLRRADQMKSRFLSNMSHEFRTPVNAILALSHLLLEHTDGELNSEQTKQVNYIRKSGEDLLELVNDCWIWPRLRRAKSLSRLPSSRW